ncbi:hypothetical protein BDZ89DRAFT_959901, partial [Hymenopellis radicata]
SPPTAAATEVNVDAGTVKLDSLGPMVVNSDGTLLRIANWGSMTDKERETTLRVLSRRNKCAFFRSCTSPI